MAAVGLQSTPATLRDYGAHTNFANLRATPNPKTDEYEVNPLLLKILHTRKIFTGEDEGDDPYAHVDYFSNMCETFKLNAFSHDDMKLKLFSQTLTSKALTWYRALPAEATSPWKDLSNAFLRHYYPSIKINRATRANTSFKNRIGEGLVRGYIRFQKLLEKCPRHKVPQWFILYKFMVDLAMRIELN